MGKINSAWRLYLVSLIPYTAGILVDHTKWVALSGAILFVIFCFLTTPMANWIKKG